MKNPDPNDTPDEPQTEAVPVDENPDPNDTPDEPQTEAVPVDENPKPPAGRVFVHVDTGAATVYAGTPPVGVLRSPKWRERKGETTES